MACEKTGQRGHDALLGHLPQHLTVRVPVRVSQSGTFWAGDCNETIFNSPGKCVLYELV